MLFCQKPLWKRGSPEQHVSFWLLKWRSCIKICSPEVQWSAVPDQTCIHWSAMLSNTLFIHCTWWLPMDPAQGGLGLWEQRQSRKKKSAAGVVLIHLELFILCLLFADASYDTSQLRGFASVVLGNNAHLTMRGIPLMDGCLLIKCFYVTEMTWKIITSVQEWGLHKDLNCHAFCWKMTGS